MSESIYVHYICTQPTFRATMAHPVRWLVWEEDYPLMREFWPPHIGLSPQDWEEARASGYEYCAVIENGRAMAVAAVLRTSAAEWMLAAVMTRPEARHQGYAKSACSFATAHILKSVSTATMMTEDGNIAMRKTAESIGFRKSTK